MPSPTIDSRLKNIEGARAVLCFRANRPRCQRGAAAMWGFRSHEVEFEADRHGRVLARARQSVPVETRRMEHAP